jgi:hypothetical protein
MEKMKYEVQIESGALCFRFDSIQDAANFANIAAACGNYKPYGSEEYRPAQVSIEIINTDTKE